MQGIPFQDLGSFKLIDHYLKQYKKTNQIFCKLFKRKKTILEKLTSVAPEKSALIYKKMLEKIIKETSNQLTKTVINNELRNCQNLTSWFQKCINDTGELYQTQEKIFNHYQSLLQNYQSQPIKPKSQLKNQQKLINQSPIRKQQPISKQYTQNPKPQQIKNKIIQTQQHQKQQTNPIKIQSTKYQKQQSNTQQQIHSISQKSQFSIQMVNNFKGLDYFMEKFSDDKIKYQKLLKRKKQMLSMVNAKKLKALDYKQLIESSAKLINNDQIKQYIEFQFIGLKGTDKASIQKWFQQVVSDTQDELEDQQKTIQKLLKTNNTQDKKKSVQISQKDKSIYMSFKVLDNLMLNHKEQQQEYINLYNKKTFMFDHIKAQKLTSKVYKAAIQQQMQQLQDQELKQIIEIELYNITLLYDGDINQWFEETVNQSGEQYQQQTETYKKYSKGQSTMIEDEDILLESQENIVKPGNQLYPIQKVISLTTISQLLQHHKFNKQYYLKLKNKKQQLLIKIKSKKLVGQVYKQILEKLLCKLDQQYLIYKVKSQLNQLQNDFAGEQTSWFNYLLKSFTSNEQAQSQVNNKGTQKINKNKNKNEVTLASQINNGPPLIKFEYLLRKLSKYQSLFIYFKHNQVQQSLGKFIKNYYLPLKKKIMSLKQQIYSQSDKNIYEFGEKQIPQINFEIFYGIDLDQMNQKCKQTILIMQIAAKSYKEYSSKLKKSSNPNNLSEISKALQRINNDINYIKSFMTNTKKFIHFPLIEEQKIEKYNLDFNKLQPNQIEILVNHIEGLQGERQLRIYVLEQQPRYTGKVHNGEQKIQTKFKISQNKMDEIMKGTDNKYLVFKIYSKGWFSTSLQAQNSYQLTFISNNTITSKLSLSQSITLEFSAKVYKPKKLITTLIKDYKLKKFPQYKHQNSIEQEFIKKYTQNNQNLK